MRCWRTRTMAAAVTVVLFAGLRVAQADNWPQWRGAKLDGISAERDLPIKWNATDNVAWKVSLPGPAGSTPVVWDKRIFLTSVEDEGVVLLCMGVDGKFQWKKTVGMGNRTVRRDEGNMASPSPSTDGKHVWATTANGQMACFTVAGEEVWRADLQERFGKFRIAFGMSSTPVLDKGRLYLQLIHGDGKPATREAVIACLDGASGEQIWKQDRPSDAHSECEHSYASPMLYRDNQREFLVTHGADYVIAHDLRDGKELWRCGDLNPKGVYNPTLRFVASPVCSPGLIVVPSAKHGPVFGLRPDGQGDLTKQASAFAWKRLAGTPDVPSPLVHGGLVYLCRENGNLICMDAKTGEELYEKRTERGRHRASPLYADGKIYLTQRDKGIVTVVKAGREFEILAKNEIGEPISASPAISNGRIYLRTFESLYAIGR